jgi:hypothetical protein
MDVVQLFEQLLIFHLFGSEFVLNESELLTLVVFGSRIEEFVTQDSDIADREFFGLELGGMGVFDGVFDRSGAHLGKVTNVSIFMERVRITLVNVTLHI